MNTYIRNLSFSMDWVRSFFTKLVSLPDSWDGYATRPITVIESSRAGDETMPRTPAMNNALFAEHLVIKLIHLTHDPF